MQAEAIRVRRMTWGKGAALWLVFLFVALTLLSSLGAGKAEAAYARNLVLPTGGRDVTAYLQRSINQTPNGGILRLPAGRYRLDGSIVIKGRRSLTIEGSGTGKTVFYATRKGNLSSGGLSWRRHFLVLGGNDIVLRRLHVEGLNTVSTQQTGYGDYLPAYEHEHGFSFVAVNGAVLEDSSAKGVFGDGVNIGNDGHDTDVRIPSTNIRISRVAVSWVGRQGVAVTHAENVLLEGMDVHARLCGIDLEPDESYQYARNVEVRDSVINAVLIAFEASGPGDASSVYVHHNTVTYNGNWPLVMVQMREAGTASSWRVEDNTLLRTLVKSSWAGMEFHRVKDVAVRRNTLPFDPTKGFTGVLFNDSSGGLELTSNAFPGASRVYGTQGGTEPAGVTAVDNRL